MSMIAYAENGLNTNQLDKLVLLGTDGIAFLISCEVSEVTDVTISIIGTTVLLAVGVD